MLSRYSVETYQGNELARNSSGNTRPQSSQLAESLFTDSGLIKWNLCALADLHFKKRCRGMNHPNSPPPPVLTSEEKTPPSSSSSSLCFVSLCGDRSDCQSVVWTVGWLAVTVASAHTPIDVSFKFYFQNSCFQRHFSYPYKCIIKCCKQTCLCLFSDFRKPFS